MASAEASAATACRPRSVSKIVDGRVRREYHGVITRRAARARYGMGFGPGLAGKGTRRGRRGPCTYPSIGQPAIAVIGRGAMRGRYVVRQGVDEWTRAGGARPATRGRGRVMARKNDQSCVRRGAGARAQRGARWRERRRGPSTRCAAAVRRSKTTTAAHWPRGTMHGNGGRQ